MIRGNEKEREGGGGKYFRKDRSFSLLIKKYLAEPYLQTLLPSSRPRVYS